jgi:hypothetical protein
MQLYLAQLVVWMLLLLLLLHLPSVGVVTFAPLGVAVLPEALSANRLQWFLTLHDLAHLLKRVRRDKS